MLVAVEEVVILVLVEVVGVVVLVVVGVCVHVLQMTCRLIRSRGWPISELYKHKNTRPSIQ